MAIARVWLFPIVLLLLAGCAKPPERRIDEPDTTGQAVRAYRADVDRTTVASIADQSVTPVAARNQPMPSSLGRLAGRTVEVANISDIALAPGEVVLTFDDGPSPTFTPRILATLKDHGVRATFMVVGRQAEHHPAIVREVALAGHTVGSHTHDHENLAVLSQEAALDKVAEGYLSVAAALAPIGLSPAPFFRFPYLAQTRLLRASVTDERFVILDVDVDSKDYKVATPAEVAERTLAKLAARGKGIVLFHDIQGRTARMLPQFLDALAENGYKVVHLVPKRRGLFSDELTIAQAGSR